jgi:hypothetical protein
MKRDAETVEEELVEISAIQDDTIKLERIVAWCATYPDEISFALRFFRGRLHRQSPEEVTPANPPA